LSTAGANLPNVIVSLPGGKQVSIAAIDAPRRVDDQIQSWDCEFKDLETSDYVVGEVWGRVGSIYLLGDKVRARMDCPTTVKAVREVSRR
jgi:phage terminase large subunit-like protein